MNKPWERPRTDEALQLIGYLGVVLHVDYDEELVQLIGRVERAGAEREYQRLATKWQTSMADTNSVSFLELFDVRPMDRKRWEEK